MLSGVSCALSLTVGAIKVVSSLDAAFKSLYENYNVGRCDARASIQQRRSATV
jgi:hypothetical protein